MTEKVELRKKVCLIGSDGVGKTSLVKRFILNIFDDKYLRTLGAEVSKKDINLEYPEKDIKIDLTMMVWDIMGQESFRPLLQDSYFFGSEGSLAVCDLTRFETLEALEDWIASLYNIAGKVPLVFLANKNDLKESIVLDDDQLKSFASKYDAPYFYTSAKTGENVERAFHELGKLLTRDYLK